MGKTRFVHGLSRAVHGRPAPGAEGAAGPGNGAGDLLDHYRTVHQSRVYGTSAVKQLRFLRPWVRLRRPASILDYGCGQSLFLEMLELPEGTALHRYDPAIPEYARPPAEPVDLLVSIDVLEHVEERDVPRTLARMRRLCRDALIVIDTRAAKHRLPDGRNAHVTLRPHDWWRARLEAAFGPVEPIRTARRSRAGFKTWTSGARERLDYWRLRAGEDAGHYARRVAGRHKSGWKVSSTGKPAGPEPDG